MWLYAWRLRATHLCCFYLFYLPAAPFLPVTLPTSPCEDRAPCGFFGFTALRLAAALGFTSPRDATVKEHFNMDTMISLFR